MMSVRLKALRRVVNDEITKEFNDTGDHVCVCVCDTLSTND